MGITRPARVIPVSIPARIVGKPHTAAPYDFKGFSYEGISTPGSRIPPKTQQDFDREWTVRRAGHKATLRHRSKDESRSYGNV
jgi:hypothetical protein